LNNVASRGNGEMVYCKNCGSELPEGAAYCPKCGASVEPLVGFKLATWGERFVAWLIDVVILSVIIQPVKLLIGLAWPGFVWAPFFPSWVPFVDFGLSNVIYFVYWMLMDGTYGRSIGKMIMRIKVTRLDGKLADMPHAALESLGKAFLLPIDCIIGWILYPRKRQRIFNYLSETIVIRT